VRIILRAIRIGVVSGEGACLRFSLQVSFIGDERFWRRT